MSTRDWDEDDDPFDGAIPKDLYQGTVFIDAIHQARGVRAELLGQVPGMLRDYAEHARDKAAGAMGELCIALPSSAARVFELQKQIAAYGDVMAWIQDRLSEGIQADLAGDEGVSYEG
jgi:hypothetical protein